MLEKSVGFKSIPFNSWLPQIIPLDEKVKTFKENV